jgi:hypothetical protein
LPTVPSHRVVARAQLYFHCVIEHCRAMILVCNPDDALSTVTHDDLVRRERTSARKRISSVLDALPPKRVWCCCEILHAVMNHKPIVLQAGVAKSASPNDAEPADAVDGQTRLASFLEAGFVHSSREGAHACFPMRTDANLRCISASSLAPHACMCMCM